MNSLECWHTDILVVGGALAGLAAAIGAREDDADVLLVSEGSPGHSGSTLYANAYITSCPQGQENVLAEQILWTGGYLANPELVDVLVHRTEAANKLLLKWGLGMRPIGDPDKPGGLQMDTVPGQPKGAALGRVLADQAETRGVRMHTPIAVVSLLHGPDSGICGALAVDMKAGKLVAIAAPQVILATGGGAAAFARSDNPRGTTGDGFRLALEAGAELVDMEFINFNVPPLGVDSILAAGPESIGDAGSAHYFLGGVRIDSAAQTQVPGLLAAGEVTGGVFGAARLGGSALADGLVFGLRAGQTAAAQQPARSHRAEDFAVRLAEGLASFQRGDTVTAAALDAQTAEIQNIAWKQVGFVKDAANLQAAVESLAEKHRLSGRWQAADAADLVRLQKLRSILLTALTAAQASLLREESRGNFWRSDYPQPHAADGRFNSVAQLQDGDVQVSRRLCSGQPPAEPAPMRLAPGCLRYDFSLGRSGI